MSLFVINGEWFCVLFFSSLSTSDVEGEKERETKKPYLFDFLHAMLIGLSTSRYMTLIYYFVPLNMPWIRVSDGEKKLM